MNREIIQKLLVQDMKYQRFVDVIYKSNGVPAIYEINLLEIIALMMGFKINCISDKWIDTYMFYIQLALELKDIKEIDFLAELALNDLSNIKPKIK
ncbi:MAG: hypothetical protein K9I48_05990 [Sphingobacteriales bacterium]|nr:hypothetical protein [Sphingobacteriales bacterium]